MAQCAASFYLIYASFSLLIYEEHLKEWTISSTGHYCQMNLLSLFRLNGSLDPGLPALGNAAKVM